MMRVDERPRPFAAIFGVLRDKTRELLRNCIGSGVSRIAVYNDPVPNNSSDILLTSTPRIFSCSLILTING